MLNYGLWFPTSYVMAFLCSVILRWEVIVCFVDIDGIVDHHGLIWKPSTCKLIFFVFRCWEVIVRFLVRGDCSFCWYWWKCCLSLFKLWQSPACIALFMLRCSEMVVRFVDIGVVVDYHCLNCGQHQPVLFILYSGVQRWLFFLLILVELLTIPVNLP